MEKSKFQVELKWLKEKHQKAKSLSNRYNHGKNKKIRDSALKDLKSEIEFFEYKTENNKFLFNMIFPSGTEDPYWSNYWEEFLTVHHFTEDLEELIKRLE